MEVRKHITFSINSILLLTLLVACNLCWYLAKVKPIQDLEKQLMILQRDIETAQKDRKASLDVIGELSAELDGKYRRESQSVRDNPKLKAENEKLKKLLTSEQRHLLDLEQHLQIRKELEEYKNQRDKTSDPYDAGGGTYFLSPYNR